MISKIQRQVIEKCRLERERWIEEDCDPAPCWYPAACPYVVYDRYGNPKCDPKMRTECGCD